MIVLMHMADAMISPATSGAMWAAAAAAAAYSVKKLRKPDIVENKKIPLMGVAGAFIFAAQMINFAIPGTGSSGHLSGGILLAAILGPSAGFLVLSVVLTIQALFFADGGLLSLGCNIINIGFFSCYAAYPLIVRPILKKGKSKRRFFTSSILGAVAGLTLGAFGVVLETAASGVTELPFATFASLMLPIHLAIGVAEGVATALALIFINDNEPAMLDNAEPNRAGFRNVLLALAVSAALMGAGAGVVASQKPDGLEWSVSRVYGTQELQCETPVHEAFSETQEKSSLFPDYNIKNGSGESSDKLGGSLAGLAGSVIVLGAAAALGFLISLFKKRRRL